MSKSTQVGGFLRNAVAVFEDAQALGLALDALGSAGVAPDQISLLVPSSQAEVVIDGVHNPHDWTALGGGNGRRRGSSVYLANGFLASDMQRLMHSSHDGLGAALATWLPRSAAGFVEQHLEAGRLVLWVYLHDPLEERRVCNLLLDLSHNTVQVHDLRIEGHAAGEHRGRD